MTVSLEIIMITSKEFFR